MLRPPKTEEGGGWGVIEHLGGRDLVKPWIQACRTNGIAADRLLTA